MSRIFYVNFKGSSAILSLKSVSERGGSEIERLKPNAIHQVMRMNEDRLKVD